MIAQSFGAGPAHHHARHARPRHRHWYEGLLPWTSPDTLNPPGAEAGPDALIPMTPPPDPDALIPMNGFGASDSGGLLMVGLGFAAGVGALVTGVMLGKR